MVDLKNAKRKQELNAALEAIYFGFRALTAQPDARLAGLGYSRIHHRVLYFVARHPDSSINQLLNIMGISKQYLHRPLQQLIRDEYIHIHPDPTDRRMKRVRLSKSGTRLENELSGEQRERFKQVFAKAGNQAEHGWRKVMTLLVESWEE